MKRKVCDPQSNFIMSRRGLIKKLGGGLVGLGATAGMAMTPRFAMAQNSQSATNGVAPSTVSNPPRDFGPNASPAPYPDADVLVVDPLFNKYRVFNTAIVRLWTGGLWSEGPAWSSQGRYLVWSDLPNNRQMRWLQDDGRVSVFRQPSNNGNGNTFDFQGRQLTCEHLTRRVVRYEQDGSVTVLADSYNGKHFNSPNDLAPHPDGSVWFTDPFFGDSLYEGVPDAPGGFENESGRLRQRVGQPVEIGSLKRELPANVYRVDPSGKVDMVISEDELPLPNGIAFSPDYKKVYVVSQGGVCVFDVGPNNRHCQQKGFQRFHSRGRKVRHRWHTRRCRRQSLVRK